MKPAILTLFACCALFAATPLIHFPMEKDENPVINYGFADTTALPTLIKPEHYTPAVVGNGLRIYGMSDGLTVSVPAKLINGACTVSMYFRPEHLVERMTICTFYHANECILSLKVIDKHLRMLDWSNVKARKTYDCGEVRLNQWHHVAWVMTGSRWLCYLDGKKVQDVESAALPSNPAALSFHIGNDFHTAVAQRDRFVGTLDEVFVRDGIVPESTIAAEAALVAKAAPFKAVPKTVIADSTPLSAAIDVETQSFVFNGKKEPLQIYVGGGFLRGNNYSFNTILNMAEQGITVFRSGVNGGRDFCGGDWWQGPGVYDFTVVDRNVNFVFERNPNAKLMLHLSAAPPEWWAKAYPEECTQDITGRVKSDSVASHSYSSEKWLKDLEAAWTALFNHIRTQPYFPRIMGYFVTTGRYGECIRYGYNSQLFGKELTDYSKPELLKYREWLKNHYGTIENMQKAYPTGKAPASFEEAKIPTPEERRRPDSSYFLNPVHDRSSIDYNRFVNDQQAEAVIRYTTMLRNFVGKDKVIGIYYGYMFEDAGGFGRCFASESGHFGLGRVLREAPIEFLIGPVGYNQRTIGCVGPCMGAPASVALHNKLWLDEGDIRTSLNGGKAEYSNAKTLDESRAILWRTFGNTLVNRTSLWWMPISGIKCFSHPLIWNDFGKMYREKALTNDVRPKSDRTKGIALIMDTESIHFRHFTYNDQVAGNLLTYSRDVFAKSGIQFDAYITDDLEQIPDDYPVYIFLNTFYADKAKRDLIARRFKKNGKLLVWTYSTGIFKNNVPRDRMGMGPDNSAELTGMKMEWFVKPAHIECMPVENAPAAISKLKLPGKIQPILAVTDNAATPLATFANDETMNGKVAVAFKQMEGWKSLYIGVPEFTPDTMRAIAKLGGAHVYTDANDVVVRPGNGYILIHSGHADNVKITLPAPVRKITNVETGEIIAQNAATFTIPIGKNETRLIRLF